MPARIALRIVQLGAIAIAIAASTHHLFDLDRFLVPKELVLHATAVLAAVFAFGALRRIVLGWIDLALLAFLIASVVSAALATNRWVALRAIAITASALLLFWLARAFRDAGRTRALIGGLAVAIVVAASLSLLQAYGVRLELFANQRAPGGTLGNRNFVAHAAAFGFPLLLFAMMRMRIAVAPAIGVIVVTTALVLTRSRAAWLAFAAMAFVFVFMLLVSRALRKDGQTWRRLTATLIAIGAGVAIALLVPNTLRWRSDNPYLESVRDIANYEEGSGRGRLVQYERSLRMALAHPIAGVGPGNWPVRYPEHAGRHDPSLDPSAPGLTFNPWPSSDWIAFVSERGPLAALLLVVIFAGVAISGIRRAVRATDADDAVAGVVLAATAAAAVVAGAFDAVLLLPLPAFIIWSAFGALVPSRATQSSPRVLLLLLVLVLPLIGVLRSTAQLVAMELSMRGGHALRLGSQIDPGNYRLHMRLARSGPRSERCAHARAAWALYPNAEAAEAAARRCR